MEWFKKHADSIATIGVVVAAAICMMNALSSLELRMNQRFSQLEKDMAVVKTVLIMQDVMPKELAVAKEK